MTVKAASEGALGELHNKVVRVMKGALDVYAAEQDKYLRDVEAGGRPGGLAGIAYTAAKWSMTNTGTIQGRVT